MLIRNINQEKNPQGLIISSTTHYREEPLCQVKIVSSLLSLYLIVSTIMNSNESRLYSIVDLHSFTFVTLCIDNIKTFHPYPLYTHFLV
jgi:hypothetical protein